MAAELHAPTAAAPGPEPLLPELVSIVRDETYGLGRLKQDALAGLTVAIVALPLSMAIAIAAGLSPERGLFTAIVGGFLISALGGSRFQIGGPAGAFIVLVAAIVERHGYSGLVLATLMAGVMMAALGALRLGSLIGFVPYPVIIGFTAGIALIIFASQIRDLLGLELAREPAAIWPKLQALLAAIGTFKPAAVLMSALGIGLILGLRRWRPSWPGLLIAVAAGVVLTAGLQLDIATIGTRFGAVPTTLPAPVLPEFNLAKMRAVLPDAIAIALLGAIESLLSAVVADNMSGRRHRSNIELVAQGVANVGCAVFGGMPATGTIARTATNVRSGGTSPISGMLHAVYLLLVMFVAAPLMAHVPLAMLGAVLAVTAWNMADRAEVMRLLRTSPSDAAVLLATLVLTVFVDLLVGITVGGGLAVLLYVCASTRAFSIAADSVGTTTIYRISGPLVFATAARIGPALDPSSHPATHIVLDLSAVTGFDSSGANALEQSANKHRQQNAHITVCGASSAVRLQLDSTDLRSARFVASLADAMPPSA
jgi:sulfate permease, SulP family